MKQLRLLPLLLPLHFYNKGRLNGAVRKQQLLILLVSYCLAMGVTAEEDGLLPLPWLLSFKVTEVFEYQCGRNLVCEIRCTAGPGLEAFTYQNVKRYELARGQQYWLMSAVYNDPVGKVHSATGILPQGTSCIIDDLTLGASIAIVDGIRISPADPEDVIFDLQPLD
ncbi:MAG: hypothetical protein KUG79_07050 [Pseudomonadales bacterium]|nr:hypothetical protein [Pseudomonadales bacterium]